jgi:hypothetical protein
VLDVEVGSKALDTGTPHDPRLAAFTRWRASAASVRRRHKAIQHTCGWRPSAIPRRRVLLGMVLTEQQVAGREGRRRRGDFVAAQPRVFYQSR